MHATATRGSAKDVWPLHSSVTQKKKKRTGSPSGAHGATGAAAVTNQGTVPLPSRNKGAEAVVQHVAQLPSFLAWVPHDATPTPALIAEYLDARVRDVVAQLEPIQQAGNYERLVTLLAELLQGDLVAGVTLHLIDGGVVRLMHGCVAAIAAGETGVSAPPCHQTPGGRPTAESGGGGGGLGPLGSPKGTTINTGRVPPGAGTGAAPIESLLPPLIDQPSKLQKDAAVTEEERAAAEMEVWENYMATARVATTADSVEGIHGLTNTLGSGAATVLAAAPLSSLSTPAAPISSLCEALCVLVERCTAAPLVCLSLWDQQHQSNAVRDLIEALLHILNIIHCDTVGAAERASLRITHGASSGFAPHPKRPSPAGLRAVRQAVWKGLSHMLSMYVERRAGGEEGAAKQTGRALQSGDAGSLSVASETQTNLFLLPLENLNVFHAFEEVTRHWAELLDAVAPGRKPGDGGAERNGEDSADRAMEKGGGFKDEEVDSDAADPTPNGGVRGDHDSFVEELQWVLRIAFQLISAQRREADAGAAQPAPPAAQLPSCLVPIVLRTLSMVTTTAKLTSRVNLYAQWSVDVLWGASLFAPVEAARQLLYATFPSRCPRQVTAQSRAEPRSGGAPSALVDGDTSSPPAMDLFLALLHQFNQGHSATHCELRDDMVCLLARLLRYDIDFVDSELVRCRSVMHGIEHLSPPPPRCPAASSPTPHASTTPLMLTASTVEAVNAIVALLFETTCGAELTTATPMPPNSAADTRQSVDGGVNRGGTASLLSLDAARRHALRFQSISTSVARRRELLLFKKNGWQLLEAHCEWQLIHLTYRECVHHPATPVAAPRTAFPPDSSAVPGVQRMGADTSHDEGVTAALWGIQLAQLGFVDVLLLYVDTCTDEAAVVAWTREELLQLELEAWKLLTSMIIFSQNLSIKSGGVRVHRHRHPKAMRDAPAQQQQQRLTPKNTEKEEREGVMGQLTHEPGHVALEHGSDDDVFCRSGGGGAHSTEEAKEVLFGADTQFITAGGIQVALRFLRTAPPDTEVHKRWALASLAAVARKSTHVKADGWRITSSDDEANAIQTVLQHHATALVPFLVKLIQEVDTFVDRAGVPAVAAPIISTVALSEVSEWDPCAQGARSMGAARTTVSDSMAATAPSADIRWCWLPQSALNAALTSWNLLRYIGDAAAAREEEEEGRGVLALPAIKEQAKAHAEDDASKSNETRAPAIAQPTEGGPQNSISHHSTRNESPSRLGLSDYSVVEISDTQTSCSELSTHSCEGTARHTTSGQTTPRPSEAVGTSSSLNDPEKLFMSRPACQGGAAAPSSSIPKLFAETGGVRQLTLWLRHILHLCLSTPPPQRRAPQAGDVIDHLTAQQKRNLAGYRYQLLMLLDVFRALVLGSAENQTSFVTLGGVDSMLDIMEAYALAHGIMRQAAQHASSMTSVGAAAAAAATTTITATSTMASGAADYREPKGVLTYVTTLLAELLESSPPAVDSFVRWRSRRLNSSPLTPDVQACGGLPTSKGMEAVQLLLCLWASEIPARNLCNQCGPVDPATTSCTGLELLRLRIRPALRKALKEDYVRRLLRRRAALGDVPAEVMRGYYRYLRMEDGVEEHTEWATPAAAPVEEVNDATVLEYMKHLMEAHPSDDVAAEQQIALLVNAALGLNMKVYGCLSTVGFDALRSVGADGEATPSLGVHLSPLERSYLVQVAALPTLCVDEISIAMAEVALEGRVYSSEGEAQGDSVDTHVAGDAATWRPTTPDRRVLCAASEEAAIRAGELNQLIEVGAQVQHARESQLYSRFLVTQLRQPVGQPSDGRPGAVKGLWKTQRRLSTTVGSAVSDGSSSPTNAVELAQRLTTRLAAEQLQEQQQLSTTVFPKKVSSTPIGTEMDGAHGPTRFLSTAPSVLGSSRTPYAQLMDSVHLAAQERPPAASFSVVAPPRRPFPSVSKRIQQRQEMMTRSLRKLPFEQLHPEDL